MPPHSPILNSDLTFVTTAPQLPIDGQLMFWLLPALKIARVSIAQLLTEKLGRSVEWQTGKFGKPSIKGEPLSLSWSHTRSLTLLALRKNGALGVDLEGPRTIGSAILQRCYTPAERALCSQTADCARRMWCLKEAYVKALGRGIGFGLQRIDCSESQLSVIDSPDSAAEPSVQPAFISSYQLIENHHGALVCLDHAPESFFAIDLRGYCEQSGTKAR